MAQDHHERNAEPYASLVDEAPPGRKQARGVAAAGAAPGNEPQARSPLREHMRDADQATRLVTQAGALARADQAPYERKRNNRNPVREHMREADEAKRLITRLHRQRLPDVELSAVQAMRQPLSDHLYGRVVIYFVPGDKDEPYEDGRPTSDTSQHRGYVKRLDAFKAMCVRIICVSSQPMVTLQRVDRYFGSSHLMLSDPELQIGEALDLPTITDGDTRRYRRITLVTNGERIERVFYPVANADAAGNARQVMTWMQLAGWR